MGTNASKSNRDYNDLNQVDDDNFEGCRKIVLLGSKAGRSTFSRIFSDFFSSSSSSFTLETKNSLDSIAFWFIFDVLTNIAGDQASELLFESLKEKPGLVQVLRDWSARLTVKEGQVGSMAILANMWNASEYFRKFYREQIMSGQVWCKPNLELLIQKIEQDQDFDPLLLFGIPTRTTKKTLVSVGRGEKICLKEAPSSKMDQIKYLHKVNYENTLVFFVDLSLFGTNMDVFITLFTKNDIEQKVKDSRIILLFTKPDLAKKRLEYGFQFSRFNGNEYKFDEKLEDITNEYMEQEAINFVLNQHLGHIIERGIRVEYHILNVIERSEVECVIPYIVNPNPSNFHFISPSLKKNTLKERLLANLSSSKLSDITIVLEKND